MEALKVDAIISQEYPEVEAALLGEDLVAEGSIVKEEHDINAELACLEMPNVLIASDGMLYSSEPEPLFTTE